MADQTINIRLNIDDNGDMRRRTQDAKEYNKEREKFDKGPAAMSSMQYGQARGASGLTGASARDFASESQGLGGLVRLYATVAANTYAATAAFKALNDAMNTENMVKGLDQLGARSGIALGTLASNMVKATGGAISLKEAMTATAQGTSAGLTSAQMLKLSEVAQKASQVLGIDVTDALSRLSRGVTKLEPELLDELGIFTKIGPATEEYARKLGKTTSQLTDFEKRQAFANAVLKEGSDKFSSIDIPTNPYKQLEASLKDIAQTTLGLINTVLAPFANLLANNVGLLSAALVSLGVKLATMAVPALGNWQKSLIDSAELAKVKAKEISNTFLDLDFEKISAKFQIPILKGMAQSIEDELEAAQQAFAKTGTRDTAIARGLTSQDKGIAANTLATLDLAKAQKEVNYSLEKANALLSKEETTGIALTASEQERLKIYLNHANALQAIVTLKEKEALINNKLVIAEEAALKKFEEGSSFLQNLGGKARAKIFTDAAARAERLGIVSEVGKTTEKAGVIAGMEILSEKLASSKGLSTGASLLTRIQGTMAAVGTEAGIAATALSGVGTALLGTYLTYELLAPMLSKNQKEELAFSQAVDTARQSIENVNRVVAELDKGFGGFIPDSIAGINALATAFTELSSQMETVNEKAIESKKAMNWFDKIGDWFKSLSFVPFVKGQDQKFAEVFSEQIESGLKLIKRTGLRERAETQLKEALGIDKLDKAGIEKAVERLGVEGVQKVINNFKEIGQEAANSSSRLKEFKSATEATTKSYQEFIQSTAVNDPVFRLGASLQNLGSVMNKLRTGEIDEIKAAMLDISKTPEIGMLFGPQFVDQLIKVRGELSSQVNLDARVNDSLRQYEERIAGLKKELQDTGYKQGQSGTSKRQQGLMARLSEAEQGKTLLVQYNVDLSSVKAAEKLFDIGLREALTSGAKLIEQGLQNASEQAALTIAKAKIGGLIGGEKAREETRITIEGLEIQRRAINTNIQLILANQQLTASIDEANALSSLAEAKQEGKSGATISRLEESVQVAQIFKQIVNTPGVDLKRYKEMLPEGTSESIANQIGFKIQGISLAVAGQQAALTKVGAEKTAASIQGQRAERAEEVKLTQRMVGYDQTRLQLLEARQGIYSNILGYATEEMVAEQNSLEMSRLISKQGLELKAINTEIADAASEETRKKLVAFQLQLLINHAAEQENTNLQQQQKITTAQIQADQRRRAEIDKIVSLGEEYLNLQKQTIDLQSQGLIYLSDAGLAEKNMFETQSLAVTQLKRRSTLEGELADLRKQEFNTDNSILLAQLTQRIGLKQSELDTVKTIQAEETRLLGIRQEQARISNKFARENFQRENEYSALERNLKYRQQDVQLDSELLQINSQVNLLTADEVSKAEKILKLKENQLAFEEKLTQAQRTRAAELSKIKEDQEKAMAAGPLRPEDQKTFEDRRKEANLTYSDEIKLAGRANDAKKQGIDLQYSMNERMKAYELAFTSAFDRMGDAIVEFAKTGKLNFSDMINSLIADLIKFELKQQTMSLYKGFRPGLMEQAGGGGLAGGIMSYGTAGLNIFGIRGLSDAGSALASTKASGYATNAYMGPAAKGKAFDQGYEVHRFAMGGAFTNQIVGSPTLFKFAQGTGMMGEAGPEAIMPLKRDQNGSLGVRSQPSNVNVVVNNHSGQPAKTNETIDSRGNRTIEVIVGDVVAQQIATKGSPVQQSMSNTYGTRPALARR